jgi:hypothetical protein
VKIRTALAAAAIALASGGIAPAATPVAGTLNPDVQTVTWTGSFGVNFFNPLLLVSPVPEIRCAQPRGCDEFALTLSLGDGFWETNGKGAVEVAIRWVYDGITDLDLQVLDAGGSVVAQSVAVDSNAESVFIPNAADGVYTVRVIASNTFNPESDATAVAYDGLAQVETLATDPPGQGHQMLPNLRPSPPDGFHISSAANLSPFPENPALSCYPEETVQEEGNPLRCLRFNQTIANVGEGPMIMRFGLAGIATPDTADNVIVQRISLSDGTFKDEIAPETYEFHEAHAHLHYRGFGQSILYPWDGTNGRGAAPVSVGRKAGFCMIDVQLMEEYWGATGNGPRAHTFPFDCVLPDEIDPAGPQAWVEQGVAVGWADVYGWNLADQYVDITNVSDGTYELLQIANPNNSVIETTTIDNCTSTVITISGDTVTPVSTHPSVPCPA